MSRSCVREKKIGGRELRVLTSVLRGTKTAAAPSCRAYANPIVVASLENTIPVMTFRVRFCRTFESNRNVAEM